MASRCQHRIHGCLRIYSPVATRAYLCSRGACLIAGLKRGGHDPDGTCVDSGTVWQPDGTCVVSGTARVCTGRIVTRVVNGSHRARDARVQAYHLVDPTRSTANSTCAYTRSGAVKAGCAISSRRLIRAGTVGACAFNVTVVGGVWADDSHARVCDGTSVTNSTCTYTRSGAVKAGCAISSRRLIRAGTVGACAFNVTVVGGVWADDSHARVSSVRAIATAAAWVASGERAVGRGDIRAQ